MVVACSPLPPSMVAKLTQKAVARIDKQKTTVVEAIDMRPAVWPRSGALRVTNVHWGKLCPSAVIVVQPQPGSICGPGAVSAVKSGVIWFTNGQIRQRPALFYGFMERRTAEAYRARGMLGRRPGN